MVLEDDLSVVVDADHLSLVIPVVLGPFLGIQGSHPYEDSEWVF